MGGCFPKDSKNNSQVHLYAPGCEPAHDVPVQTQLRTNDGSGPFSVQSSLIVLKTNSGDEIVRKPRLL